MKITIGSKSGKTFKKELSKQEAEALQGKKIGESLRGEVLGLQGIEVAISGGSDEAGFPMRRDIDGVGRKKIVITRSVGFRGKVRGKSFSGLRVRKMVAGNTIHPKTSQVNFMVTKEGAKKLAEYFEAPAEEKAAE